MQDEAELGTAGQSKGDTKNRPGSSTFQDRSGTGSKRSVALAWLQTGSCLEDFESLRSIRFAPYFGVFGNFCDFVRLMVGSFGMSIRAVFEMIEGHVSICEHHVGV